MSPLALLTLAAAMLVAVNGAPVPRNLVPGQYWKYYADAMKTLHAGFDLNHDGKLTQDDFTALAQKHIQLNSLQADPIASAYWTVSYQLLWNVYNTANGFFPVITPDRFVEILKTLGFNIPDVSVTMTYQPMWLTGDYNHDLKVTVQEFIAFYKPFDATDAQSTTAYNLIDLNHDANMSWEELDQALIQWVSTCSRKIAQKPFLQFVLEDYDPTA